MAIKFNPGIGCIVMCDFRKGFLIPEMVKRRPVIILTPPISARPQLCTIVPLSTSIPNKIMPYHLEIEVPFPIPEPFNAPRVWVKGDMVSAVGFHRLDLIRKGKDETGKRQYFMKPIDTEVMIAIRKCVLSGLGMAHLTKHL